MQQGESLGTATFYLIFVEHVFCPAALPAGP